MTAMEWLVVLGLVVAGVFVVGCVAETRWLAHAIALLGTHKGTGTGQSTQAKPPPLPRPRQYVCLHIDLNRARQARAQRARRAKRTA